MTADKATAAPESAPRISVSLVGRLGVRFNGRPIELRTRKAGAVLSYLALSEMKQESRERLVGLLWSRSTKKRRALRCGRSFVSCGRCWRRPDMTASSRSG
jgi:hypothetical protein